MRKYHRWIALLFGVLMLWIAATGVAMQLVEITADDDHGPPPAAAAPAPGAVAAGAAAMPAAMPAPAPPPRQRTPTQKLHGFIMHLHSGEYFGPVGTALSILSGLALIFFAVSGMWMYLQMFRARARRSRPGEGKWFW